jgi:hypothetical protein
MRNFARLPAFERQTYFEQAAARLNLTPPILEKDFWVCWTLNELFNLPHVGAHLTFKGGTSLSKVFKVIERFSEDIDVTISREHLGFSGENDPENAPSNKQRRLRLAQLKTACASYVTATVAPELEKAFHQSLLDASSFVLKQDPADPDQQTLLFEYPSCWGAAAGAYIHPAVKLEFGARSDTWPNHVGTVTPYVAEQFPASFPTPSCNVQALAVERTFWEKACLLHEENFRPASKPIKPRMSRHYYDLYRLIKAGVGARAAADVALFERVVEHRSIFFAFTWLDYSTLRRGSLQVAPTPERLAEWEADYRKMTDMFFTAVPDFSEVLSVCRNFQQSLNEL